MFNICVIHLHSVLYCITCIVCLFIVIYICHFCNGIGLGCHKKKNYNTNLENLEKGYSVLNSSIRHESLSGSVVNIKEMD